MVEWWDPPSPSRVVLVPCDGGHPPLQRGVVDCFWMDPSGVLGTAVQPHRVASVLERLDAPPKEDFQKIHARHSVPNELDHALHQHFYLGFLLRKHLQRRRFVHSVHGERRQTKSEPSGLRKKKYLSNSLPLCPSSYRSYLPLILCVRRSKFYLRMG